MKRLLLLMSFLLAASPARAAIALVANGFATASASPVTTAAINMTGATLLVVVATSSGSTGTLSVSDNSSNTWNALTLLSSAGADSKVQIFYAFNPTVTASQTFTETTTTTQPAILVLGFSGTLTTAAVFDAQSGVETPDPTTTAQPGSITPAQAGEVFVTGAANNNSATGSTINLGFTITDQTQTFNSSSAAYLVNSGSAAQNPTWTFTANTGLGIDAVMATFKPAGAAAPAGVNKRQKLLKLGIGGS